MVKDLRTEAISKIKQLIANYESNRSEYLRAKSLFNETQTRQDFINPLLRAFGWDVDNEQGLSVYEREVIHEHTIASDDSEDNQPREPDYGFRIGGKIKFYIEAKKPSISIESNKGSAFQARSYGWSAGHPVSFLTNFEKLIIYDCGLRPVDGDDSHIARMKVYNYNDYVDKFDEIYSQLSRDAVATGNFDELFPQNKEREGSEPFDKYFLKQIESWREKLVNSLVKNNPNLTPEELNFVIQRLINRIVFLRICEDRELEKYKGLQSIHDYAQLKALFKKADEKYNSGLFDFVEDQVTMKVGIDTQTILDIFRELYYPYSPYVFSVVDPSILGEIYEHYLGKAIQVSRGKLFKFVDKPEVIESGGVIPTPIGIVETIAKLMVVPRIEGKSPAELSTFRIADIACGSGNFLLSVYSKLLVYYLGWYVKDGKEKHPNEIRKGSGEQYYLTLQEKQRILLHNIYGVDIDPQAVEATQFSLLLKTLENESKDSIMDHASKCGTKALPNLKNNIKCGNSLVDLKSYSKYASPRFMKEENIINLNPFDWSDEFRTIYSEGFFDLIVGNPPYIRIQNMVKYTPDEAKFYHSEYSPFTCSKLDNFDKYSLFIERALTLLKPDGQLGYIVPNKFFKVKSGKNLRGLLSTGKHVFKIIDFGVAQVFGNKVTIYTCIIALAKNEQASFTYKEVSSIKELEPLGAEEIYSASHLTEEPWTFIPKNMRVMFERLRGENPTMLKSVAKIFVGVQTSADKIYIITALKENKKWVSFKDMHGRERTIEKGILRPFILDAPIECFGSPRNNAYIIFPYEISEGKAKLYTEKEMKAKFKKCWEYLQDYEGILGPRKRNIMNYTSETWYRYGRSQSLTKFDNRPKLIWPILSLQPRYGYDVNNIVISGGGNGPYYALRPLNEKALSIFYIQAILSHPVFEEMVREKASKFRGGYASHGKQYIECIPIKVPNFKVVSERKSYLKIIKVTKCIIAVTNKIEKTHLPRRRQSLDRLRVGLVAKLNLLVNDIYRISNDDLEMIEKFKKINSGDASE